MKINFFVLLLILAVFAIVYFNLSHDVKKSPVVIDLTLEGFDNGIQWHVQGGGLPVDDFPAEGNNGSFETTYIATATVSGGTANLYIKADGDLINGLGDSIPLENQTFNFNFTDRIVPGNERIGFNTSDILIVSNFSGGEIYFKFFVSIPPDQAPGYYQNNITLTLLTNETFPISPPSDLEVIDFSEDFVLLEWQDNSGDEDGFRIERSITGPSSGFSLVGEVEEGTTTFLNTGLSSGTSYWYRVYAFNGFENSTYSNTVSITTPEEIQISLGNEEIVLDESLTCEQTDLVDVSVSALRIRNSQDEIILYSGNAPRNYIMNGTNFNNLQRVCSEIALTATDNISAESYDNQEWISKAYTVDGENIYALIHNEYHDPSSESSPPCLEGSTEPNNNCWYNSISTAFSSYGHIFSQPTAPNHSLTFYTEEWNATQFLNDNPNFAPTYGYFHPSNIINHSDGFFYFMFESIRPNYPPSSVDRGTCITRTNNLSDIRSWRSWDGIGFNINFTNPYVEGQGRDCAFVSKNNISTMSSSLTYNTFLGKYMLVSGRRILDPNSPSGDRCGFFYSLSDDLINWDKARLLKNASFPFCNDFDITMDEAYPSIIDHNHPQNYLSSRSFEFADEEFYLYFMRRHENNNFNRSLIRIPINLSLGLTEELPAPSDVEASEGLPDRIEINWTSIENATIYYVYRSLSQVGCAGTELLTNSPNFTDTSMSLDTLYYYSVFAGNSGQNSSCSNIDSGYAGNAPGNQQVMLPDFDITIINNPDLETGSNFGGHISILDFNGDGVNDIATIGGEKIYVFYGPDFSSHIKAICPEASCGGGETGMVKAGNIDSVIGEDLIVGAPGASANGVSKSGKGFLVSRTLANTIRFVSFRASVPVENESLGQSASVGDFDRDGNLDIALGGNRIVFFDSSLQEKFSLYDPYGLNNFGVWARTQYDLNGQAKSLVAVGEIINQNNKKDGIIYVYNAPINQTSAPIEIRNPIVGFDIDFARFGMGGPFPVSDFILIGSPRQDIINESGDFLWSAGAGHYFKAPDYEEDSYRTLLKSDYPGGIDRESDLNGYRVFAADVIGDNKKEIFIVSLNKPFGGFTVYDSQNLSFSPDFINQLPDTSTHYPQGITTDQLFAGGFDEFLVGDTWYPQPGGQQAQFIGRIVIYKVDESGLSQSPLNENYILILIAILVAIVILAFIIRTVSKKPKLYK